MTSSAASIPSRASAIFFIWASALAFRLPQELDTLLVAAGGDDGERQASAPGSRAWSLQVRLRGFRLGSTQDRGSGARGDAGLDPRSFPSRSHDRAGSQL